MQNPKSLSELLAKGGNRLAELQTRSAERSRVVEMVKAAVPPKLGLAVVSAGIDNGRLTVGVASAVWASRLRYYTEAIRKTVSPASGTTIVTVRIKVVPPRPAEHYPEHPRSGSTPSPQPPPPPPQPRKK